MAQFIGNILLQGKIECLTGLHVGGGKDKMEIGGVDSPVVRDPNSRYPYIPGSSLKGKMRMLLEFSEGKAGLPDKEGKPNGKPHSCDSPECPVCRVFGSSAEGRKCGPTRLMVRDAYPDEPTQKLWEGLDSELLYTELKSENFLDRLTSAANPRFIERVVKGSKFDLDMVFGVYQVDEYDDLAFFPHILTALWLLEHSALGGSGTRGYGRVRFRFAKPIYLPREAYQKGLDALKQASQRPKEDGEFTLATETLKDEVLKVVAS